MHADAVEMKSGDCTRCLGCGYIADDDDGTPWKYWAELPEANAIAVHMGLVRPQDCPACHGTGSRPVAAQPTL